MRAPKLLIAVALLLATLLALLVYLRELDLTSQQDRVASYITAVTGRQVEIRGGLHIGLSLRPRLVAHDVELANAAWGSQPTMLSVSRADITLALGSLLRGAADITRLDLRGVTLLLERAPDGRGNWDFEENDLKRAKIDEELEQPTVFAEQVRIEDFVLELRTSRGGDLLSIDVDRLELAAADASTPFQIELEASLSDRPVRVSGVVGSLSEWLSRAGIPLDVQVTSGGSSLTAKTTLDLGSRPRLAGRVTSGNVDLDDWRRTGVEVTAAPAPRHAAKPGAHAAQQRFSTRALGLGAVGSFAVDLDLAVGRLATAIDGLELTHAEVSLERGVLRLSPIGVRFDGSDIDTTLEIDANRTPPRVDVSVLATDLDLGDLLARLALTTEVEGYVDVAVRVSGTGDSVAAILASLDGHAAFAITRGTIPTRIVDRAVADLFAVLMPWSHPPKRTEIRCAVTQLVVEAGVARSQILMLDSERLTVRGGGDIDLRNETIHLDLSPRPRDRSLLKLATDVRLSGALSAPKARPTPIGLAKTAVRFVFGPARVLSPFGLLGAKKHPDCVDDVKAFATAAADEP